MEAASTPEPRSARPNPGGASGWFLAQCKPGQEHLAADRLAGRGLARVFLPRERRNRRWRGRVQTLLLPVFPGYLFLSPAGSGAATSPDWAAIRSTRGVTRIVSFEAGMQPALVPLAAVEALAARCDAEGVLQPPDDLRPGEAVRITGGAFADLVATIERIEPDSRLRLLLDLMGRQVPVALDRSLLRRPG